MHPRVREKLIEQVLRRTEHQGGAAVRIASDLEHDVEAQQRSQEVRARLARVSLRHRCQDEVEQRELDKEGKGKRIPRRS